jgi:endonuclease/exonuclease/phosphatase (EEP) superfamily protein YafD
MVRKKWIRAVDANNALHEYGQAKQKLLEDSTFSFLVWNVNKHRIAGLSHIFDQLPTDPDFYFLQEVSVLEHQPDVFAMRDAYHWVMGKHLYLPSSKKISGVKTGATYHATQMEVLHSAHTESLIATPKVAVLCTYPIEGTHQSLLTINVHLLNFVSLAVFAKELQLLEHRLAQHKGPLWLTGDFNTWSRARKACLMDMIAKNNMHEVALSSPYPHRYLGKQLSFVFTRGINVEQTEVLRTITLSDHYPLWGQARLILDASCERS